ncbi:SixA phosphatase family protein [Granulosicoccus sp. 3-233]|uniref:SixA phosphatase family protein n=1 Tax=Granulosicoccus sp. 3-233 TaxID=3417969 RepID=UPI003D33EF12
MSQYVTLVRHAKSSWKNQGQSDFDRPLNDRGNSDGPVMAKRLVSRQCIPDLMLVSSARRAQETSAYLQRAFNLSPEQYRLVDDLYMAEPEILLDVMAEIPEDVQHLMVIAHNPGLEQLSELLAGRTLPPMPTLGIRHFACPSIRALAPPRFPEQHTSDTQIMRSIKKPDTHRNLSHNGASLLFDDYPKREVD